MYNYIFKIPGFFAAISTIIILGVLEFFQVSTDVAYQKFIPLCVSAILFGAALSVILYLIGGRAPVSTLNPKGNSGNFLKDLLLGRQISPVLWGRLDIKFIYHRISLLALVS